MEALLGIWKTLAVIVGLCFAYLLFTRCRHGRYGARAQPLFPTDTDAAVCRHHFASNQSKQKWVSVSSVHSVVHSVLEVLGYPIMCTFRDFLALLVAPLERMMDQMAAIMINPRENLRRLREMQERKLMKREGQAIFESGKVTQKA